MKYQVYYEIITTRTVAVEASSADEARRKVLELPEDQLQDGRLLGYNQLNVTEALELKTS